MSYEKDYKLATSCCNLSSIRRRIRCEYNALQLREEVEKNTVELLMTLNDGIKLLKNPDYPIKLD